MCILLNEANISINLQEEEKIRTEYNFPKDLQASVMLPMGWFEILSLNIQREFSSIINHIHIDLLGLSLIVLAPFTRIKLLQLSFP